MGDGTLADWQRSGDFIGISPGSLGAGRKPFALAQYQLSIKAPEVLWLAVSTKISAPMTRDAL